MKWDPFICLLFVLAIVVISLCHFYICQNISVIICILWKFIRRSGRIWRSGETFYIKVNTRFWNNHTTYVIQIKFTHLDSNSNHHQPTKPFVLVFFLPKTHNKQTLTIRYYQCILGAVHNLSSSVSFNNK